MNSEPLLLATPSGDGLELRPEGPWIAANVSKLESLFQSVKADVDRSRTVTLDMAGVSAGQSAFRQCDDFGRVCDSCA